MNDEGLVEGITHLPDRTAYPHYVFLVAGGAGSIGRAFVEQLLEDYPTSTIRVVDKSEHFLWAMRQEVKSRRLRWIEEDITDYTRMKQLLQGVDIVINCAASKHVSFCEYNPFTALKNNIHGTKVLIEASLAQNKPPLVFLQLSTDKAVNPTSAMGASKLMAERLVLAATHIKGDIPTRFVTMRLPNVMQTMGNVFQLWAQQKQEGKPLTVTHKDMRRYVISIHECTNLMGFAVKFLIEGTLLGGEIVFPAKMKEYSIKELAKEYSDNIEFVGTLAGEKIREELYTETEENRIEQNGPLMVIHPEYFTILKVDENE